MRKMNRVWAVKRFICLLLSGAMIFTSFDVTAMAATEKYQSQEELKAEAEDRELREELKNMVKDEEHPDGVFALSKTVLNFSEGEDGIISVVRAGNTDKEASVVLKVVDISAEYGLDYTISVADSYIDKELKANPDMVPLLQTYGKVADPTSLSDNLVENEALSEVDITDDVKDSVSDDTEEETEKIEDAVEEEESVSSDNTVSEDEAVSDNTLSGEAAEDFDTGDSSLAAAYKAQTGEDAPVYDWREYHG